MIVWNVRIQVGKFRLINKVGFREVPEYENHEFRGPSPDCEANAKKFAQEHYGTCVDITWHEEVG